MPRFAAYVAGSQRAHVADRVEVTIVVGHRHSMAQGACCDQAVDPGADGEACTACGSAEADRFFEDL